MNNNLIKMMGTRQAVVGALVFLFPFLSLVTGFGVSLVSFLILIASLFFLKEGVPALRTVWPEIRWVVLAFLFKFLFVLMLYLTREEALLSILERPLRMLMALSALLLVLVVKPDRKTLWWGVIGGAVAALALISYQRIVEGVDRPGGLMNAITFGDLSLCLALVAIAAATDMRHSRFAIWPAIGALAGLAGSIMTGTRGGWIALLFAGILLVRYSHAVSSRRVRGLVAGLFILVAGTYFVPETGVRERVHQGVVDVTTWLEGGNAFSNVGIRLELWKGAGMLIDEYPLLGRDSEVYKKDLARYVAEGKLDPVVLPMPHLHNDALQSFVTGGVPGFLTWFGTLLAPFLFFADALRRPQASKPQFALALAGVLVVSSFFGFGLTETIFWSVKATLFYGLMVFLLMGFYLNAKALDGK
jgi:O-antigen ligase